MPILLAFLLLLAAAPARAAAVDNVLGKLDLAFEQNEGQVHPDVKFFARGRGYTLFLTRDETVMRFTTDQSVVRMKFLGGARNVQIAGADPVSGTTNYFRGDGASRQTNIRSYKQVLYSGVYRGIDVAYHGSGPLLEYDLILQPGADPHKIRIGFSGARSLSLDSSGDLLVAAADAPLVQKKPRAYQEIGGRRVPVDAAYAVRGNEVGFRLGDYDKAKPLIIDPELVYSTFFGGTGTESTTGIAVDSQGAVYVSGTTTSTDFPNQSAAQGAYGGGDADAFVFKLDPTGTQLIYATFIGGSSTDEAHSIAVDAGGNAYLTGFTLSNDFPVVNGFQNSRAGVEDAYVLKLNSTGAGITFSTLIGGSGDDRGTGIALDAAGSIYVSGITGSSNFPTANAYQNNFAGGFADGFILKLDPAGNKVYSTFIGGVGSDNPLGIAVDGAGAAYITGWTTSVNYPMVSPFQKTFGGTDMVFVSKLNPSGASLDYSTFVGGTGSDEGTRIAVDGDGNAYVTGTTTSLNFPTVTPYQALLNGLSGADAFLFKLSPAGNSLVFSTYFGGSDFGSCVLPGTTTQTNCPESGSAIALDSTGAIYIAGFTQASDLPTANATQTFIGGNRDAFVAKFAPAGNVLVFSTYLGATGAESATALAVGTAGTIYVAGFTNSADFLAANAPQSASVQTDLAGAQDLFVAKMNVQDIVSAASFAVAPAGASSVISKGTRTDAVFGYASAESTAPAAPITGLEIIDLKQSGATVSEVGIAAPPYLQTGRFFVDVASTGRSVLSIANPNDQDATVNVFYTDSAGATNQFTTITVPAHQHFSRFVTDAPLNVLAPGTLNFDSNLPVAATAFFTSTNESSELILAHTPIVDPVAYTAEVGNKPVAIPEFADGGGWKSDVVLVNTSEDQMHGEVRFFNSGAPGQPGTPTEVGIGDDNSPASAVEFDIPPRSFQKVSTSGAHTISETPFGLSRGTSVTTPGAGAFQTTGWASADANDPNARLNGLEILRFRQLGITQSQTPVAAPAPRQTGRFFAEVSDKVRSFLAIANPNAEDVSVAIYLTDSGGTSTDPVTVTVPAGGQYTSFLTDAPISLPANSQRTVTFSASLPVLPAALRFFTNERSDSLLSPIPITDIDAGAQAQPRVVPRFADGAGWKTQVILVNNSDAESQGEIRFFDGAGQPVVVGVDSGDAAVFQYDVAPRSFFIVKTNGLTPAFSAGYVQIVPFQGSSTPGAYAIFSDFVEDEAATAAAGSLQGNTIFEASVEGQTPSSALTFYAEGAGEFNAGAANSTVTAVAIANPSGAPAVVQLQLTSFADAPLATASVTIPAGGEFADYLPQIPGFGSVPAAFQGVLRMTVTSGSGVAATAFRVLLNERKDYIPAATGPLSTAPGIPGRLVFPYISDSTGYTTEFILINPPGVQAASGVLHYLGTDGAPLNIDALNVGWVQIAPFPGSATPFGQILLFHRDGGVLTTMVGFRAELPAAKLRMYGETQGNFASGEKGSTLTTLALTNPSDSPSTVVLEARKLDGSLAGVSQPLTVPAKGQLALLLSGVSGLQSTAAPFEGVITVAAQSPQGVTLTGFRAMNNEQGNVLFTSTGPLHENAGSGSEIVFPHIAEGGGYTTQFIVIGGSSGQAAAGALRFFSEDGNPLNLTLAPR